MASINLQGDTSGSISISAPSVAGNNTLTLPATTQTLATQNALGVRNRIINGDMRIDQRNAGASGSGTSNAYTVDRWQLQMYGITNAVSYEQVTDAPTGFQNSLKITSNATTETLTTIDSVTLRQKIEGNNVSHLLLGTANAKTITLSFWVKASITGTYPVSFTNNGFNRSYVATYTVDSANTWEQKTVTLVGDTSGTWVTDTSTGLAVMFAMDTGTDYETATTNSWVSGDYRRTSACVDLLSNSSATWQVTGVQLEVGDTATPFEHRPYDMELARCQRYFENLQLVYPGMQGANYGSSSGSFVVFKVEKRAVPSITDATIRNGASGATTSVAASTAWTTLCSGRFPHTGLTATTGQGVHVYATNGIHVDAEL